MNRSLQFRRTWTPPTSCRARLAGTVLMLLLAGCATPQKDGSYFANLLKKSTPVHSASYQEAPIDESPKKINDPLELKLRYARWMEEIKNYPEAQQNYNLVLQERPADVDAMLGLARIDQAANRLNEAEAGFKKALQMSPDSAAAKDALGQLYVSQDRYQEALPLLSDAILADAENKAYRFHLAVALAKSGDVDAAYPHFKQVVGDVVAHFNLGMILKSRGQYRQAEQQFLQALAKNPDFEQAKQAMAEVRQLSQSSGTYAAQPAVAPQIQPAYAPTPSSTTAVPYQPVGHESAATLTSRQQEQLRNQRILQR